VAVEWMEWGAGLGGVSIEVCAADSGMFICQLVALIFPCVVLSCLLRPLPPRSYRGTQQPA
jgi:hypothetical protein